MLPAKHLVITAGELSIQCHEHRLQKPYIITYAMSLVDEIDIRILNVLES